MSMFSMIILGMLLGDAAWWIWAHRMIRNRRVRLVIDLFMGIQLACLVLVIIGRVFGERSDEVLPRFVMAAIFVWHFILLPAAVLVMLLHLLGTVSRAFWWRRHTTPAPSAGLSLSKAGAGSNAHATVAPTRRDFLRTVTIATPPFATALVTGFSLNQLERFRIRSFDINLPQLPQALDGLTIAHVTDIHVGRFTSTAVLRKLAEQTNNLRADLVLLTGDLINHAIADLPAALDAVKRMDARHGVFMCEGNHDLMESRDLFEQGVKRSGVPLLVNESTLLKINGHDVQLLGLRWGPGRSDAIIKQSTQQLLTHRVADAFPILLAHHPHAFDVAADAQIPMTLAGHTHGGQLMLAENIGFGPMMFRYWSGLYEKGNNKLVVSNGVGNWFPLRINAPAEIVHITLHRSG
jgi:predicted MPP superfamily phosphohydrolase